MHQIIVSATETSSKMASTPCKNGLKNPIFVKRLKFRVVSTIRICSNFTNMWYKHFVRNVCRDFTLTMSALATVARKNFNGKFTEKKKWFSDRAFYVANAEADIESLKSRHTLFDKYLDHMLVKFETKSYGPNYTKFWAFWQKWLTTFDKVLIFWRRSCDWNNYLMLKLLI